MQNHYDGISCYFLDIHFEWNRVDFETNESYLILFVLGIDEFNVFGGKYDLVYNTILGCGDNKESEIPEITTDGTSTSCSGTAPVIQEIICENTGLVVENDSQENLPTFTLNVATTDDDGDLTSYTMLIEFDAQIDDELSEDAVDLDVFRNHQRRQL